MISIIVAIANNNAIGKNNEMPWHLSDDLKRFKSITMGNTVIMGKNTWLSLPFKPLKGRRNIVVSSSMPDNDKCEVARSIEEALSSVNDKEQAYIIGGAQIYRQTIEMADELIVTHINAKIDGADTFFPEIDMMMWEKTYQSSILLDEASKLEYQYITYRRKTL